MEKGGDGSRLLLIDWLLLVLVNRSETIETRE